MQQALDTDTKINARYDLHYQHPEMEEWRRIGAFGKAENIISMCSSIPHDRIIDVGCGEGAVLEQLLENDFSQEYVGAEISDGALELLRRKERLKDVELIHIDDYAIDVQDQRFDLAVLSHVLEHVEHPRRLIAEVSRIAKYIFVEVPLERTARLTPDYVEDLTGHINFYDRITIRRFLQTCGLTIVDQRITDTSKELVVFQHGKMGRVRHLVRKVALNLVPTIAQRIFVYHAALLCRSGN